MTAGALPLNRRLIAGTLCYCPAVELGQEQEDVASGSSDVASSRPAPVGSAEEAARRRQAVAAGITDKARWSDPDQFEAAWNARAQAAATYIPVGAHVLDLGCGAMALEKFLPAGCAYQPCDLVARDARTIVCDFNKGEFPAAGSCDFVAMLGVLEYVFDAPAFLKRLAALRRPVVMSYCAADLASLDRAALGWVNAFTVVELARLLAEAGLSIERADRIDAAQVMLRLSPVPRHAPAEKRVAVIAYHNVGNFGDRLGFHLLNQIMPPHARVSWVTFRPFAPPPEPVDLAIVGIGNSLFDQLFVPGFVEFVRGARRRLGIFGTQYRSPLLTTQMAELVPLLDVWHARYADDAMLYGRGRANVRHLGDWLIQSCAMAQGRNEQLLRIGQEMWNELPLDRTIQNIQQHRRVFSTRLHPLLCALTSAEEVGYRDPRELNGQTSGKFRSMLLDVFGRDYPEDRLWQVDRRAVVAYKAKVAQGVSRLARDLAELLA